MQLNKIIIIFGIMAVILLSSNVNAGVGIMWTQESALSNEGEEACLTYNAYNPWEEDTYVEIGVTDELLEVLTVQQIKATLIPAHTGTGNAIPIEFCFEVPDKIYDKNCWLGDFFVCEKRCEENQRIYRGDVEIRSVPPPEGVPGGSAAIMAVSAPLNVKVRCTPHGRDYTLLLIIIAIIALIGIILILRKKYGKTKEERIKEEMKELREKMKSIKKKK